MPNIVGNVKRSEHIKVKALNENGDEVVIDASGYLARAFQHEIDHLNGIIFTDKATEIERMSE